MQSGRLSDGEGDRFRIIQSVSQSAILFHSDAVAHGRKDECKLIISVWNQVFRTCNTPPAVLTTQTGLYLVDTEISQISLFHLLRVSLPLVQTLVQRLDGIVQGRCGEGSFGHNLDTIAGPIQHLPPADIGLCSVFLRTDIRIELLCHALAVDA